MPNSWGESNAFANEAEFKKSFNNILSSYINQSFSPFGDSSISNLNDSLTEKALAERYINEANEDGGGTLDYTIDEINSFISQDCAVGDGLKNVNLTFTPEEYLARYGNMGVTQDITLDVKKEDIQNLKEKEKAELAELLRKSSIDYLSDNMADIFLKMHFTKKQDTWTQHGTSRVMGGAGWYNDNPSGSVDDKTGQTYGYINEIYQMVEYMYLYRLGTC